MSAQSHEILGTLPSIILLKPSEPPESHDGSNSFGMNEQPLEQPFPSTRYAYEMRKSFDSDGATGTKGVASGEDMMTHDSKIPNSVAPYLMKL